MIVSTEINYTTRRKSYDRQKIRPFGKKDELGYVFGDMAGSFVNLFIDAYFLTFCTYVLGISPAWMGSLFLFARLGMRSTIRLWDLSRIAG